MAVPEEGKKKKRTIQCPECDADVRPEDEDCPECGLPIRKVLLRDRIDSALEKLRDRRKKEKKRQDDDVDILDY